MGFILVLAFSFLTIAIAQDTTRQNYMKQDTDKTHMGGGMNNREMNNSGMNNRGMNNQEISGPLKSATCDVNGCGFMIRSHNEKEITSIMKNHAKTYHHKTLSEKEIKSMIRSDEGRSENDIKQ